MSNWYGSARTNYVKVKDLEGLMKALEPFSSEIKVGKASANTVMFMGGGEYGDFPSFAQGEDEEGCEVDLEFRFEEHVLPYLEQGEVLVVMTAGAEKMRYITGHAEA